MLTDLAAFSQRTSQKMRAGNSQRQARRVPIADGADACSMSTLIAYRRTVVVQYSLHYVVTGERSFYRLPDGE